MADEVDNASTMIDNEIEHALRKMRESAPLNVMGAKECIECDDAIPLARQKLGFSLCVPCAEEIERKKQLYNN